MWVVVPASVGGVLVVVVVAPPPPVSLADGSSSRASSRASSSESETGPMSIMLRLSSKMSESSSDEEAGSEEGARDETGAGADAVGGAGASAVSFDESAARARSPGEDFNSPGVCFVSSDGPVSFEGSVWAAGDGCDSVATGANSSWTSASRTTAMFGSGRTGGRDGGGGVADARVALTTASAIASTSSRSMAFDGEDSGGVVTFAWRNDPNPADG